MPPEDPGALLHYADVDADGDADQVWWRRRDCDDCELWDLQTYLGDGTGRIALEGAEGACQTLSLLTGADLGGDAYDDLVLWTRADPGDRVLAFRGGGDGLTAGGQTDVSGRLASHWDLVAGDFDGDCRDELVALLRDAPDDEQSGRLARIILGESETALYEVNPPQYPLAIAKHHDADRPALWRVRPGGPDVLRDSSCGPPLP